MRHFALRLQSWRIRYAARLDGPTDNLGNSGGTCGARFRPKPQALIVMSPAICGCGRHWNKVAKDCQVPIQVPDRPPLLQHRLRVCRACRRTQKQLRIEFFYRELRQKTGILMDGTKPLGGQWNYDEDNRESFWSGSGSCASPTRFAPDEITQQDCALVNARLLRIRGRLMTLPGR